MLSDGSGYINLHEPGSCGRILPCSHDGWRHSRGVGWIGSFRKADASTASSFHACNKRTVDAKLSPLTWGRNRDPYSKPSRPPFSGRAARRSSYALLGWRGGGVGRIRRSLKYPNRNRGSPLQPQKASRSDEHLRAAPRGHA